jgi:hypothetical protein
MINNLNSPINKNGNKSYENFSHVFAYSIKCDVVRLQPFLGTGTVSREYS